MATIFAKGLDSFPSIKLKTEKNILLLTGPKAESLVDLVDAINNGRKTNVPIEYLEPNAWIEACAKDDVGGKGKPWFEARLVFTQGVCDGDAAVVGEGGRRSHATSPGRPVSAREARSCRLKAKTLLTFVSFPTRTRNSFKPAAE